MTISFFTNYLNHYQISLAKAFEKIDKVHFTFVLTEPLDDERIKLGWEEVTYKNQIKTYDGSVSEIEIYKICIESDVAIFGSSPEKFIKLRLQYNKLTFRYSERIFKKIKRLLDPRMYYQLYNDNTVFKNKNFYLLCAGGMVAKDFRLVGAFKNKSFKWGYFPEIKSININEHIEKKKNEKIQLLWAGRMIEWKRPNHALRLLAHLIANNIDCHLTMAGNGPLEGEIKNMAKRLSISNNITFVGGIPPETVMKLMYASDVFLFTSNREEGWGVVLNEAMGCGCTIIANKNIGAVPYLLEDGINGIIYDSIESLFIKGKEIISDRIKQEMMAKNAYLSVSKLWTPEVAANRFVEVSKSLLLNIKSPKYNSGPLSTV